ncbi:MAG: hypothetical protein WC346_04230 [Methanogenium sp.]|jgi:hypothetical protein
MADYDFGIKLEGFSDGLGPLAHLDSRTFLGSNGQASSMRADIISNPGFIQQSPALANLTNGTQAGVVDQLIRFILDKPTDTDETFGIGTTKLFKLSSTTVTSGGTPSWPQTVTDMTEGESVIRLKANLYGFFNTSSGGDILKMPLATEVIDPDWGSSTDAALEDALHPVAAKEDIMVFGNGRYVGVYVEGSATLDVQKLDFGEGAEVADVVYNANLWYIAVNYGEGRRGQIYLYDGSAVSNVLTDEAGLGSQKIGFLFVHNGIVYVAYQDNSSGAFAIGWMSGRQLKPLRYFAGTLPDHRQKTLYKNTILFISDEDIFSCGATVEQLPVQISDLADAGYTTVGGLAAPFGTPMVASTDGSTNYRLAKFSGLSVDSNWKSLSLDVTSGRKLGKITCVIVTLKTLAASARVDLSLEGNQGSETSSSFSITGTGLTRKVLRSIDLPAVEDVRVVLDSTNGHASNACPVRKIELLGIFVDR